MAYDYEKSKKLYEKLTPEQQKKFAQDNTGQVQEFLSRYNAEKNQTANQTANTSKITNTPAATTTTKQNTTNVAKPEYQGTGGATIQPKDRSWDKGNGQYTYNPKTGYYESGNQTSTTSSTNNKISVDSLRNTWDSYDYNKQQELLNKNPGLQDRLTKYGITNKQSGESRTVNTPAAQTDNSKNKNPDGTNWDYQDNSQERMDEIIGHLDDYTKTNPGLFSDYDTFYNAFIKGKGRTPEQEKVINDFFKKMKQYNKYDNMSSDSIGQGLVNGTIPDDYLTYIKNTDPQRLAEIQEARKNSESQIMNESYLYDMAESAGFDMGGNPFLQWNKETFGLEDKNKDGLWDTIYHAPTQEELQYEEEANQLLAQNVKIDNTIRWMEEDLIEQYPDADYSTIMLLKSDRGNKLLKERDSNNVALTKLQGQISYLQNEREAMDKAGLNQINELQQNLGMYYQYTPQGMSELSQAQYAAENVTLDQADNGTDTQKQMALDSVLTDYFDKYGSIIQRSKSQVINDVMAYAKKNGVSLSQALQENFIKPLKQKPGFNTLNTVESKDPYVVKVGDVAYRYNPETDEFELITGGVTTGTGDTTQFGEGIRTGDTIGNDINSIGHILDSEDGLRVGTYKSTNGYTYNVYANREDGIQATENLLKRGYYGMTLADAAQKRIGQGKDISAAKKVIKDKGLSLDAKLSDDNARKFIEAMGTWEGTLKSGETLDDWAKESNNDFSAYKNQPNDTTSNQNSRYGNKSNWNPDGYSNNLVGEYEAYLADPTYENNSDLKYKLGEFGISFEDFTEQARNYARTGMKSNQLDSASSALEAAIDLYEYINGAKSTFGGWSDSKQGGWFDTLVANRWSGTKAHDAKNQFDTLQSRLTLDKLIETKKQGATYGSMTEGEWKLLQSAATNLDWSSSSGKFQKDLEDMIWTLTRTVIDEGALPSNFANSAASKYYLNALNTGKYDPYMKDNTPMDYNNTTGGGTPSRIS